MSINNDLKSSISVILFGFGLAALLVTMCHCIINRRRAIAALQRPRPANNNNNIAETPSSIEISTAQLIPAYKFYKGMGLVGDDGDTCVICLAEFEEGEELRTLPECLHSYHVPCIDMWLNSHSNCPMCRTDAMPTPHDLSHLTEFNWHGSEAHQNLGMPQNIAVVH